ncbi:MAG: recombinase RecT, partial [Cystobacter sp.]
LARRANPKLVDVEAALVYEGEKFLWVRGFNPILRHKPRFDVARTDAKVVACYVLMWTKGVERPHVEVMSRAEIEYVRAQTSFDTKKSPWKLWWGEMAKKTVLKRGVKTAGLNPETYRQFEADDHDVVEGEVTARNEAPARSRSAAALPSKTERVELEFTTPAEKVPLVREEHAQASTPAPRAEPKAEPPPATPKQEEPPSLSPEEEAAMNAELDRKAAERVAAETAVREAGRPAAEAKPTGFDTNAPGFPDSLAAAMRAVQENPAGTMAELQQLSRWIVRAPADRRHELDSLYLQIRGQLKARKA